MDLGLLLESPQGSLSSSRVVACTCAFLPSGSSRFTLPFPWIKGSVGIPRGFPTRLPTGLYHVPPWCESFLGMKVEAVQGNRFPWNGLRHLGVSGNGGTTLEFLSPFLWRVPPLEMRRERGEFFPHHAGKGPSSREGGGNGAPLDVGGPFVLPLGWRMVCRGTS